MVALKVAGMLISFKSLRRKAQSIIQVGITECRRVVLLAVPWHQHDVRQRGVPEGGGDPATPPTQTSNRLPAGTYRHPCDGMQVTPNIVLGTFYFPPASHLRCPFAFRSHSLPICVGRGGLVQQFGCSLGSPRWARETCLRWPAYSSSSLKRSVAEEFARGSTKGTLFFLTSQTRLNFEAWPTPPPRGVGFLPGIPPHCSHPCTRNLSS